MKNSIFAVIPFMLIGCASQPDDIQTAYVSDLQYNNSDCDQLQGEALRISQRPADLHGRLKDKADGDAAQMCVGLILFWPTLFFLEGGDGAEAHEYSRLKGEREAIERASVQQKCTIQFEPDKA